MSDEMETNHETQNPPSYSHEKTQQAQNITASLSTANWIIQQLMSSSFQQIKQKQLALFVPNFMQFHFMGILNEYIYQSTPNYGTSKPSKLEDEDVSKIIKIEKDNLSPKQLPSQLSQKNQTVNDLPEDLSAVGSKKLGMTNRSSFMKRNSSQIGQIATGPVTQRVNLSFKSNKVSQQKTGRSISIKKDPFLNFTSIMIPENEDPEINHLRQKVHFNIKQKEKEQILHNERQMADQQKINNFNIQFGEKGQYTFDFDGGALGSEALKDQKINYYAMKVALNTYNRKYRTIYKHVNDSKNESNQNQLLVNKGSKVRQSVFDFINLQKSTIDIPVFQMQQKVFIPETDPLKLKVLEYKRLYGKKFSRYDKNSMTIDFTNSVDKKATAEDFSTSRKYLTDSVNIKKSRSSSMNKEQAPRKLALPKLQGKYKVLDRYQSIDFN